MVRTFEDKERYIIELINSVILGTVRKVASEEGHLKYRITSEGKIGILSVVVAKFCEINEYDVLDSCVRFFSEKETLFIHFKNFSLQKVE